MNPVALSPAELRTADRIRAPILSSGLLTLLVVTGLLDVSLFGLALGLEPMLSQRDQAFVETAQQFDWLSRAAFAATIATYLIFVWWLGHRAAQLSRLRIAGQRHVPRFVIITSLLPVINGFLSLAIITELWKASSPKVDFEDTRSWRELPASNLLIWWWISLMAAGTGFAAWVYNFLEIARSLKQGATLAVTEALSQHFTITLVFSALQLTSVLLTLALVVWLNDRQQKRFRAICWHNQEHSLRSHEAFAGTSAHSPLSVTHCFQALGIAGVFFVLFALAGALFELPAWVNVVSSQVVLMAVALSLARSERVPLSRLACLTQPSTRQLMSSVMVGIGAFGFAALTFLPLLAQFFANQEGEAQFQQLIESSPSLLWILPLLIVIVAPLVEEILFRGVLFEALASALSTSMVILITTVVFALIHLNPPQIIATFILGVHCGLVRWASGSVVPAIFVHLINNLGAITFLPMLLAAESVSALLFASVALMTIGYGHLFGPLIRQRLRTLRSVAEQAQRYPALEASVHSRVSERLAVAVARAKPWWIATLDNLSNIARFLLVQLRRGSLTHLTLKLAVRRFKESGGPGMLRQLRGQLWGGSLAHGLAILLALAVMARFLLIFPHSWRQNGSATLAVAAFFGYWAWGMWKERRMQSMAFLGVYALNRYSDGLWGLATFEGFGLWNLASVPVFMLGTLAVFRGNHVTHLQDLTWPSAPAADLGPHDAAPPDVHHGSEPGAQQTDSAGPEDSTEPLPAPWTESVHPTDES